jgi:hypothetical protein
MQMSEHTDDLFAALAKAQSEIESIPFNRINPHFKSKYADLAITIEKTKPALSKNGLMVIQAVENDGTEYFVESMLVHSSGQWIKSRVNLILNKNDMQGVGSATTYAKRYAAQSLLFVAGDDDDDANAVSQPKPSPAPPVQKPVNKPENKTQSRPPSNHAPAPQSMIDEMHSLCIDRGVQETELNYLINKGYGVSEVKMPTWIAREIVELLRDDSTTSGSIMAHSQRVTSRREAARLLENAGQK